jgi:putative transposase
MISITEHLALAALTAAYWRRKLSHTVKLHSDQCSQYTSHRFKRCLTTLNIKQSISRRDNCWGNALAESLFSNLKKEKVRRIEYKTRDEARQAMSHYIKIFYTPKQHHTNNGRLSPSEHEKQYFGNPEGI